MTARRWRSAVAATTLAAVLASCGDDQLQGLVQEPPLEVADVSFPVVGGDERTMVAAPDGLLVVYFGFTNCPDICPTTLSTLSGALDELDPEEAARIEVGMVTVDPERDTDDELTAYLDGFLDEPLALREIDAGELLRDAERFGVSFQVEAHDPGDTEYDVGHTPLLFVIDETGTVRVQWPYEFERAAMVHDLELLLP